MNTDNLFGIKIDQFSRYYITLLKSTILFRYGISDKEELKLSAKDADFLKGLEVVAMGEGKSMQDGLIVGTIRMGYGHHRMAYSLYSHSIQQKRTILHDILAIDSNEARAIKEIDGVYSYLSRLSSENGGIIEWLWGQLTSQGNANSLFLSVTLAEEYKRLVSGISPKLPYLSTYPINGQVAVAAGFSRVIHLIPDNFPQYYLLVPGALNLVQSPSSYMKFINMGVPKENLMVAGHWVSEPILTHLEEDTAARIERIESSKPKRFLLPIGGAGAQKKYTMTLLEKIAARLKNGEISLLLNTGDHVDFYNEIIEKLKELEIDFDIINESVSLSHFCRNYELDKNEEPKKPVTVFHFASYYTAFLATDYLIRVADVLVTKPSELAFFPIPKIFIRRVGDHEAASASRSMELGEGTIECREVEHAVEMFDLLSKKNDVLKRMNDCIQRNLKDGIYNGSRKAVEIALNP